jgi:hypothetical protein
MATRKTQVELSIPRTEVIEALRTTGSAIPDPAVDTDVQNMKAEVVGPDLVISWSKETTE